MTDREKKREGWKNKNLNIKKKKRAFLMKKKAFFVVFEGLSFDEKNKDLIKIADTSFNFEHISHLFSTVSIVDFKQVNVSREHFFFCCRP